MHCYEELQWKALIVRFITWGHSAAISPYDFPLVHIIFNFGINILLLSLCMRCTFYGAFQSERIFNHNQLQTSDYYFSWETEIEIFIKHRIGTGKIGERERERAIFKVYPNNAIMLRQFNFPPFSLYGSSTINSFPQLTSHFVDSMNYAMGGRFLININSTENCENYIFLKELLKALKGTNPCSLHYSAYFQIFDEKCFVINFSYR